jgi:hypothetical protein
MPPLVGPVKRVNLLIPKFVRKSLAVGSIPVQMQIVIGAPLSLAIEQCLIAHSLRTQLAP